MNTTHQTADGGVPGTGEPPSRSRDSAIARANARARWDKRWKRFRWRVLLLILLGAIIVLHDRIFVRVDSGQVLLVYYTLFNGTMHNRVGQEGLHVIAPWDQAYLYQTRTQTVVNNMTVLSKNGVEVTLDAQIRFHATPEMVPYLHRQYGPGYVDTTIKPQLTEAVQKVIGQYLPEEIYSSETGASVTQVFSNAKKLIGGVYLDVEDISLLNISLPDKVQSAIQAKLEAQQNALAYDYRVQQEQKETERKQIEAKGLQQYAAAVSRIPRSVLVWKAIEATTELAKSPNSKVIVFGSKDSLPLLLGNVPDIATEK